MQRQAETLAQRQKGRRRRRDRERVGAALGIKSETTSQFTVVARADRIIYMNRTFK